MDDRDKNGTGAPKSANITLGILRALIYIGVAFLCFFDVFRLDNMVINYVVGGLLCVYGIWRIIRVFKTN